MIDAAFRLPNIHIDAVLDDNDMYESYRVIEVADKESMGGDLYKMPLTFDEVQTIDR